MVVAGVTQTNGGTHTILETMFGDVNIGNVNIAG
jgi:hypothetical protein